MGADIGTKTVQAGTTGSLSTGFSSSAMKALKYIPLGTGLGTGIWAPELSLAGFYSSGMKKLKNISMGGGIGTVTVEAGTTGSLSTGSSSSGMKALKYTSVGAGIGAITVGAGTAGLSLAGFTSSGVLAGSLAAGIQAGIGNVATGSLFATMQALGAGAMIGALPVVVGVGATGGLGYWAVKKYTWFL